MFARLFSITFLISLFGASSFADEKCLNLEKVMATLIADVKAGAQYQNQLVDVKIVSPQEKPSDEWMAKYAKEVADDKDTTFLKGQQKLTQIGCARVTGTGTDLLITKSSATELELKIDVKMVVKQLIAELKKPMVKKPAPPKKAPKQIQPRPGEKLEDAIARGLGEAIGDAFGEALQEAIDDPKFRAELARELEKNAPELEKEFEVKLRDVRFVVRHEKPGVIEIMLANQYGDAKLGLFIVETHSVVRWGKDLEADKPSMIAEEFISAAAKAPKR